MNVFPDEERQTSEPIPGLPEALPEGEKLLWQGHPDTWGLMFGAFRLRWIAAYVLIMTGWRLIAKAGDGAGAEELLGTIGIALIATMVGVLLLWVIARAMSHATIFTITSQRVVLRYGIAIRKYVNAPFAQMVSAQIKRHGSRLGDISLQLTGPGQLGYFYLWPFARPFQFRRAHPMLRSIASPEDVSALLANAVKAHAPEATTVELGTNEDQTEHLSPNQPVGAVGAI
ncbi:MAG: photosynthetic complex putative assembly protein PuhB [Pseudomonadota bacterium]